MAYKQESQDSLDIDRYINFDQVVFPSPSASSSSSRGKAIATPEFAIVHPSNAAAQLKPNPQPTFSGPSHQYDNYKQQTGIPLGALANTLAVPQPSSFAYGGGFQQGFSMPPSDGYFGGMTMADDMFDFNSMPTHNPTFSNAVDVDMEFDSPVTDLFNSNMSTQSSTDYVDPHALGGQEDLSPTSPPAQNNVRLWPGMHSQQAAMAKAQAVQQQKQQQQQPQRPKVEVRSQAIAPPQRQSGHRPSASSSRPPSDPIVEERISRLLHQMRHNSDASSHDDAATPTNHSQQQHFARQRKDEEDMDEDERLLASEEGKKLSSKERRQLRNKVSARAFRSRRKEYIGQLEGELATKAKESDDLRAENEALKTENTRLTDLTRMLLSSPAFSSFLNDLSTNGVPSLPVAPVAQPTPSSTSRIQQQQQQQPIRKDANPHSHQRQLPQGSQGQESQQVGMTLIPDSTVDFAGNMWANAGMDYGFNHAQVFSVMDVPLGPAVDSLDLAALSGKPSVGSGVYTGSEAAKEDVPVIERMPSAAVTEEVVTEPTRELIELDASNPAFALFLDNDEPASDVPAKPSAERSEYRIFGTIEPEKAFARLELVVRSEGEDEAGEEDGVVSAEVMERFERLCAGLEEVGRRIEMLTSHL